MANPKISIIIPAYNHGKELPKCLDSIFLQTLITPFSKGGLRGIFEIIIVNDGSTDGTKEILDNYLKTYPTRGIKIINQPNHGAPVARNNGFRESKGDYVIFLDADIELRKDALEKMLCALEENTLSRDAINRVFTTAGENKKLEIGYAYSDFRFGFKKFKLFSFDGEKLKKMNYIHTSALIRRDAFPKNGFDPTLKKFQDWDLWLTMLEEGHIGVWIPEVLFKAKPRKQGMSEWIPSFMYGIPWVKFGINIKVIEKYEKWKKIISQKHNLKAVDQ